MIVEWYDADYFLVTASGQVFHCTTSDGHQWYVAATTAF
jgi:hypothetical protein